jgi:hypothetical protein
MILKLLMNFILISSISSIKLSQYQTPKMTRTPTSTPKNITYSFGLTKSQTPTITSKPRPSVITTNVFENTLSKTPTSTLTSSYSVTSLQTTTIMYVSSYYKPAFFNITPTFFNITPTFFNITPEFLNITPTFFNITITSTPTIKNITDFLNSIKSPSISPHQNNQLDNNIFRWNVVGISFGVILCIALFFSYKINVTPKTFYKSVKRSLIDKKENTIISAKENDKIVISNPESIYNNINKIKDIESFV